MSLAPRSGHVLRRIAPRRVSISVFPLFVGSLLVFLLLVVFLLISVATEVPAARPSPRRGVVPARPGGTDFLTFRERPGLSPAIRPGAAAALKGGWAAIHVVHEATAAIVGMGRLIGGAGWHFQVLDMAVLPEHQRRGLGIRRAGQAW